MSESGTERPYTMTDEVRNILNSVSTATITSQLQRRGLTNCFLNGLRGTQPGTRMIGYARTLRYVALREDLAKQVGMNNAQRKGVEGIQPDEILVIEKGYVTQRGNEATLLAEDGPFRRLAETMHALPARDVA